MLAIVQHDQDLAPPQMRTQRIGKGRARHFLDAERLRERRRDARRILKRPEFRQQHAVTIRIGDFGGDLQREPRLADPATANDRDQPPGTHQPLQLDQLALAPNERGRQGGKIRAPGRALD